jgi:hypothetical protein
MRLFTDYAEAACCHEIIGGWLLNISPGYYGVTIREDTVVNLRGEEWVSRCEKLQCWDETELDGKAPRRRRAA